MGNRTPAGCFSEHLWSRGTLGSETVLNPEASKLQTLKEPYAYEHVLHVIFNLNCTDNYDVAKIKVKSVTDHQ